ncbi:hypothetical protein R1flu_023782 [Riccia fluitans]|uniref:Uncharacterized protein n=1 Tax=Riccia fluitans TaxID=41844 RepID=A0ABD1XT11_9MARC
MDPSVVADESLKLERKAPDNLYPLAKLAWVIRTNKYKPTPQEGEVLGKCFEDAKWYFLNAPLAAGALVWSVTGGTRLKVFPRIFLTVSAAVLGHDLGGRMAGQACTKNILSLEKSPLRGELIAILREDQPDNYLLKTDLVQKEEVQPQPAYVTENEVQESLPATTKDWASRIDDRFRDDNAGLSSEQDFASGNGDVPRRIPRLWKPEPEPKLTKPVTREESGVAEVLGDPFDLVMRSSFIDDFSESAEDGGKGRAVKETRRSRRREDLSAKERKEYDRKRYEQWKQRQQQI